MVVMVTVMTVVMVTVMMVVMVMVTVMVVMVMVMVTSLVRVFDPEDGRSWHAHVGNHIRERHPRLGEGMVDGDLAMIADDTTVLMRGMGVSIQWSYRPSHTHGHPRVHPPGTTEKMSPSRQE